MHHAIDARDRPVAHRRVTNVSDDELDLAGQRPAFSLMDLCLEAVKDNDLVTELEEGALQDGCR